MARKGSWRTQSVKGTRLSSRNHEFSMSLNLVRVIVPGAGEMCHFGEVGENWHFPPIYNMCDLGKS